MGVLPQHPTPHPSVELFSKTPSLTYRKRSALPLGEGGGPGSDGKLLCLLSRSPLGWGCKIPRERKQPN